MNSLEKNISTISPIVLFSALGSSQTIVTIKLIVDTENFEKKNWPAYCHLEASRSDSIKVEKSTKGKLECFSIDAFVGDIIIWEGESSNSENVIVDITKIKRAQKSGTKIFKNRSNYGKKNTKSSKNESVNITVLYNTVGKADYKYNISFKINGASNAKGTYKIDPKMKIMPRTPIV